MRDLPPGARVLVLATSVAGVGVWLGFLPHLEMPDFETLLLGLLLFVAALVTEFLSVTIRRAWVVSISTMVHVAAILLLPMATVATVAGAAVLLEQMARRLPWYKVSFNTGSVVLTVSAAGLASRVLGNPIQLAQERPLESLAGLFLVALTYQAVTSGLLGLLMSQLTGRPFYLYMVSTPGALPEIATAVLGGLVAFVWHHAPLWTVPMLFPAAVVYLTFRYIHRVVTETDSAVETMAKIVDERDHYTYVHSTRVAEYAELLARALKLDADEVETIVSAARVHDLGKIGVGNRSLYKEGKLDESEREEMESHPVLGARILGHFEGYRKGVKYVLHHHERWDGKGYPHRLKGEEIPLGARIIAVADAFDAMTTDRPYRSALSSREALSRIRAGIGTQFDPVVAGHFLALEAEITRRLATRPHPLPARPVARGDEHDTEGAQGDGRVRALRPVPAPSIGELDTAASDG